MDFSKLERNIISVIKESQIKLGYDSMTIGINYVLPSLIHLLGECDENEVLPLLEEFTKEYEHKFGLIEIYKTEKGYRLNIPAKGADLVHKQISDDDFLVKFINAVRRFDCTIDEVTGIFRQYSDKVHIEKMDNGEFDYLIYFEDGMPDEFWYCIDTDDFGMSYHRFTKEDYLDFNF